MVTGSAVLVGNSETVALNKKKMAEAVQLVEAYGRNRQVVGGALMTRTTPVSEDQLVLHCGRPAVNDRRTPHGRWPLFAAEEKAAVAKVMECRESDKM